MRWLRAKYPRLTWKQIRRRYWGIKWTAPEGARLAWPVEVAVTRYRYRGHRIPSPWALPGTDREPPPGRGTPLPDQRHEQTACPVESRMHRNGHVLFGGRVGETGRQ
jgi:hypothetical protein